MERTFKAAYFTGNNSGTGGGIRLTEEHHADRSNEELVAEAMKEAKSIGLDLTTGEISVGDWSE